MLKTFVVFNVEQIDGPSHWRQIPLPHKRHLTRCRRLKICSVTAVLTSLRKDKTPFSCHQQMRFCYLNVVFFPMPLAFMPRICMRLFTGAMAKVAWTAKWKEDLAVKIMHLKSWSPSWEACSWWRIWGLSDRFSTKVILLLGWKHWKTISVIFLKPPGSIESASLYDG